jgi:hypothetical protein
MSALESGMSMAPMALGQFLSAMRAPQIIKRYGIRSIQIGGLAQAVGVAALGAVFMGISANVNMGAGFLWVGAIFLVVALSYTVLGARVADRREKG